MLNIKTDFPLISEHQSHGSFSYLDNSNVTQLPKQVVDTLANYYTMGNGPTGSSAHALGIAAATSYKYARKDIAAFLDASTDEIVFCSSRAEAMTKIASGYASYIRTGDEIVLPFSAPLDHVLPWQHVAQQQGAKLVYLLPDGNGRLTEDEIYSKIGAATKVVVCAQTEQWTGTVVPLQKLATRAHEKGAICIFDYSLSLLHTGAVSTSDGADALILTGNLVLGPSGVSVIKANRDFLEKLSPVGMGSKLAGRVSEWRAQQAKLPERLECDFDNHAAALGLSEALRYLGNIGAEEIRRHDQEITEYCLKQLQNIPGIRIFGKSDLDNDQVGIISFCMNGICTGTVASYLASKGIAVGTGADCIQPFLAYLLTSDACHINLCLYNTKEDVDALIDALRCAPYAIGRQSYSRMSR